MCGANTGDARLGLASAAKGGDVEVAGAASHAADADRASSADEGDENDSDSALAVDGRRRCGDADAGRGDATPSAAGDDSDDGDNGDQGAAAVVVVGDASC